jgi:zinc transport system substrate-binding protein
MTRNIMQAAFLSLILTSMAVAAPPKIVVSILPLHACVSELTRDVTVPTLLIQPSQSPHTAQLTPTMRRHLNDADLIVYTSAALEDFLTPQLRRLNQKACWYAMEATVPQLLQPRFQHCSHTHTIDPHFWLSIANMQAFAKALTQRLIALDPPNTQLYQRNHIHVQNRLKALKQELTHRALQGRFTGFTYVAYHDAYQYFDQEFGTQCLAVITHDPHQHLRPQQVQSTLETLRQAKALFFESQFKRISRHWPCPVDVLNPYGQECARPGLASYEQMMYTLIETVAKYAA